MLSSKELGELLRGSGYKVTPQRLAVYEVLAERHWHPSAEMLYAGLQQRYPAISLATVYKTVEILQKINVIQIINIGENSLRYDADIHPHHHVQCTLCGSVADIELKAAGLDGINSQAEAESGYLISGRQFNFYGICPNCRREH